jgi:hypothetical protein
MPGRLTAEVHQTSIKPATRDESGDHLIGEYYLLGFAKKLNISERVESSRVLHVVGRRGCVAVRADGPLGSDLTVRSSAPTAIMTLTAWIQAAHTATAISTTR